MGKKKGFTLIELLVVIAIIALLMSILMPALAKVRNQAKDVVCRSNIKQLGLGFAMFVDSHNGYFNEGYIPQILGGHSSSWMMDILPYYGDVKLLLCPMANKFKGVAGTTWEGRDFSAWNYKNEFGYFEPQPGEKYYPEDGYGLGSYGVNEWTSNAPSETLGYFGDPAGKRWWKTPNVRAANNIPLVLDGIWSGTYCRSGTNQPMGFPNCSVVQASHNYIGQHCRQRHGVHVNSVFVDFSVRKVGLKELWTFEWYPGDDTANPYTIVGHGGNKQECADHWDTNAEWMKNMKEY